MGLQSQPWMGWGSHSQGYSTLLPKSSALRTPRAPYLLGELANQPVLSQIHMRYTAVAVGLDAMPITHGGIGQPIFHYSPSFCHLWPGIAQAKLPYLQQHFPAETPSDLGMWAVVAVGTGVPGGLYSGIGRPCRMLYRSRNSSCRCSGTFERKVQTISSSLAGEYEVSPLLYRLRMDEDTTSCPKAI